MDYFTNFTAVVVTIELAILAFIYNSTTMQSKAKIVSSFISVIFSIILIMKMPALLYESDRKI